MRTLFILTFLTAALIGCAPTTTVEQPTEQTTVEVVEISTDGPVASPNPTGMPYASNVVQLAQPAYTVIIHGDRDLSFREQTLKRVYEYIAQGYIIQHQTEGAAGRITFTLIKY